MLIKKISYYLSCFVIIYAVPLIASDSPRSKFVARVVLLQKASAIIKSDEKQRADSMFSMRWSLLSVPEKKVPAPFKDLKKKLDAAEDVLLDKCLIPRFTREPTREENVAIQDAHKSMNAILKEIVDTCLTVNLDDLKTT